MTERGFIDCARCGARAPKTGNVQRFCASCSAERHRERQARYATAQREGRKRSLGERCRKEAVEEAGRRLSAQNAERIQVDLARPLPWSWSLRVKVPFARAASKNYIYGLAGDEGHRAKRAEQRAFREMVADRIRSALAASESRLVQNKVWIEIFVQKPDHRGDAINLIHTICDGIKGAIGIDDRWFAIARLDWQIVKADPQIIIGLFQETDEPAQACSCCGRILPLRDFKHRRRSIDRICRTCVSAGEQPSLLPDEAAA